MNASARTVASRLAAALDSASTTVAPGAAGSEFGRFAVMTAVVGAWMGIGWALDLGAVAYLLTGIPLTVAFQLLVARRPLAALWLVSARSLHLDRVGIVLAIVLAGLPVYATALGLAGGRLLDVGYGLVGVVGAVPAAFALRAMDAAARTALLRSILTAGVVATMLFVADRVMTHGATITDVPGAVQAGSISLLLYIPMVFVIEEVFFRGALDTYARGSGAPDGRAAAIVVSLLWGAWHLPLVLRHDGPGSIPVTMAFHLVVGLLLTGPWRRSGNLAVPGITHAVIDAIRDGLAAL